MFNSGTCQMEEHEIGIATYRNRSVCQCGFPALNETVPIEKKYRAIVGSGRLMNMQCGGCRQMFELKMILVEDHDHRPGFYLRLPLDIFNPESEWEL